MAQWLLKAVNSSGFFGGKAETLREIALSNDEKILKANKIYVDAWKNGAIRVPRERSYFIDSSLIQEFLLGR